MYQALALGWGSKLLAQSMRALVVSDIHGNLQALEAVMEAARGFDQLWNLGDAVGYGANPNEVLSLLRDEAEINVRGNHDRVCAGLTSSRGFNTVAAEAAAWTEKTLTPENLAWLRVVPQGPVDTGEGALCAHGSPLDEDHYILSMRDAWLPLQRMRAPVTFFGHTHVQGAFWQQGAEWEEVRPQMADGDGYALPVTPGSRVLVNPGSVGQPRNNDSRAAYAVFDATARLVTFHRVPYDIAGAQRAIRDAGLPDWLAARLDGGR